MNRLTNPELHKLLVGVGAHGWPRIQLSLLGKWLEYKGYSFWSRQTGGAAKVPWTVLDYQLEGLGLVWAGPSNGIPWATDRFAPWPPEGSTENRRLQRELSCWGQEPRALLQPPDGRSPRLASKGLVRPGRIFSFSWGKKSSNWDCFALT